MQTDNEPKFCKDCAHFRPGVAVWGLFAPAGCLHPDNLSEPDLIYGERYTVEANDDLRKLGGKCGPDGAMFEKAPPAPKWEPCAYVRKPTPPRRSFWAWFGCARSAE